jgi:hypothetical protein
LVSTSRSNTLTHVECSSAQRRCACAIVKDLCTHFTTSQTRLPTHSSTAASAAFAP